MPAKKARIAQIDDPRFRQRLELLYARKSNIDSLIRSLEQYNRYQVKSERGSRKTA